MIYYFSGTALCTNAAVTGNSPYHTYHIWVREKWQILRIFSHFSSQWPKRSHQHKWWTRTITNWLVGLLSPWIWIWWSVLRCWLKATIINYNLVKNYHIVSSLTSETTNIVKYRSWTIVVFRLVPVYYWKIDSILFPFIIEISILSYSRL